MSESWKQFCIDQLDRLAQQQVLRTRGGSLPPTALGCSDALDFSSNDYLGLRRHPHIFEALQNAAKVHGWGSGASPVLSGYSAAHHQLESLLAKLSSTEDCLVFSSGFACNVGVLSSLLDEQTLVLSDRLNHASLIDGMRLGKAAKQIYNHCDMQDLKTKLDGYRSGFARCLIVTESVFSMDGDEAPLQELVELSHLYDCGLVVDEAHAFGVFGDHGGGLLDEQQLSGSVLLKLGTLSKALGGIGGYAAGSKLVVDTLVNRCRSYLFSTAPPAATMIAGYAAAKLLCDMKAERAHLLELASYTRQRLTESGWRLVPGRSPIIPIIVGHPTRALELSSRLRESGMIVPAIRPPTVPADTCRLRISLSASHTKENVQRLCDVLKKLGEH